MKIVEFKKPASVPDASGAIREEIARIVAPLPPQDRDRLNKLIAALVTNEVQDLFIDEG